MSNMTPDRVLAGLAKEPDLFWEVLFRAKILGAWVEHVQHHKGTSPTTTWVRRPHPRLAGSSPVEVGSDNNGFYYRIDLNNEGGKDTEDDAESLDAAKLRADELLREAGWVLVDDDEGPGVNEHLRDKLQSVLRLLGEGKQSFIDWQADVKLIDIEAPKHKWTKQQIRNRKQRSWKDYIRNNAMPRNHTVRGLLTQVVSPSGSKFPDTISEFFAYCDEYDDLFATWDQGAQSPLATGRNFPAGLDGFILGMMSNL